jgi:phage tail sheath protein FI
MPEYLAPGVYVEEIPSGNRPIQAASTSTAGMVGMTARGPVNRPTLVTSLGAYARIFGGDLDPLAFTDGRDTLPYAAEGFFTNGGARLYVVRVVGGQADESRLGLVARSGVEADPVLVTGANAGESTVVLDDPGALAAEDPVLIAGAAGSELVTVGDAAALARPVLGEGLRAAFPEAATVTVQAVTELGGAPTDAVEAGATEIVVTDTTGITAPATLLITDQDADERELIRVDALDGTTLTLAAPVRRAYPATASLSSLSTPDSDAVVRNLTQAAGPSGAPVLLRLDNPAGVDPGAVVLVAAGADDAAVEEHAQVTAVVQEVTLAAPLTATHAPGARLIPAVEVLTVHARWPGGWGDSLRVTVSDAALVQTTTVGLTPAGAATVTVATPFGLHPGTVLVFDGGATAVVAGVDTDSGVVSLTAPTTAEIPAATTLASQEFSLLVERVEAGRVVESEAFDRLSMAAGHPRNALTVVGAWDTAAARPAESGAAQLVRLSLPAADVPRDRPFVTGVPRMLDGGSDDVAGVTDATYVGDRSDDPDQRTGVEALRNEPTLSIVAVPGRTSLTVQNALVAHCEDMRYRFAVLDVPPAATVDGARSHRQNFDSTRAALYYPDVSIADRFGAPGDLRTVAPSGHVLGVYARTDLTRGVHKAPANEVLRGAQGLRTALTKGEQDILNPINLNCLRDFRSENRGLRVYGARVATSDPEWRYVNVRRLLLFIEQSLDTGLQFAVFEPNDKPLWDTVKQSITGFLTTVWRSGALEGTTAEEAFFVNIGYDVTMDQADIDNGRLIVEVGVAPVKPAEFVIVRISQKTREATA